MSRVNVTDHAVLRYLQRARGVDVEAVRRHVAELATNGARLGATGVTIENVKLVLRYRDGAAHVVTALEPLWPAFGEPEAEA